jgi:hypothetical protein
MPTAQTEQNKIQKEIRKKVDLPPGRHGNTDNCPCIDLYALADAIYVLMKQDLRLERERMGRR